MGLDGMERRTLALVGRMASKTLKGVVKMDKKTQLMIEAMSLAFVHLDEILSEEEIQELYGSDYYMELKRFTSYEWRSYFDK